MTTADIASAITRPIVDPETRGRWLTRIAVASAVIMLLTASWLISRIEQERTAGATSMAGPPRFSEATAILALPGTEDAVLFPATYADITSSAARQPAPVLGYTASRHDIQIASADLRPPVSVHVTSSNLMRFTVRHENPAIAISLANELAERYFENG